MTRKLLRWARKYFLAALLAAVVAIFLLVYAADWLVLLLRGQAGNAHGAVVVDSTDVMREKGNRLEFFDNPPQRVPCVRALFPHEGQPACWWLERHADVEQYLN